MRVWIIEVRITEDALYYLSFEFHLVDEACCGWFCQQRYKGASVSGVLLQEKAHSFFMRLYPDDDPQSFKGSTGWLTKFNKCHGINSVQLRDEILSSDLSAVDPFCEELAKVIAEEGYSRDQIFNADDTELWWRMTPSSSLSSGGATRAANFKKAQDCETLLACANTSGIHRLSMVFINKNVKPRCFKHMDISTLPVHYCLQKKSWMDCSIFSEWFLPPAVCDICEKIL